MYTKAAVALLVGLVIACDDDGRGDGSPDAAPPFDAASGHAGPALDAAPRGSPDTGVTGTDEDAGGDDAGGKDRRDGGSTAPSPLDCEIGVSDEVRGLCFRAHDPETAIPLVGSGQAELLAELAIRARHAAGAAAELTVTAMASGRQEHGNIPVGSAFRCEPDNDCDDLPDGTFCKAVPVHLATQNLVDDPFDLRDLPVRVELRMLDANGVFCTHAIEGFLHRR